jgi:polysaccharide biosynthesis protein PslF
MRVMFICGAFPAMPCGVGDNTARLAEGLSRLGVEVYVMTKMDPRVITNPGSDVNVLPAIPRWGVQHVLRIVRMIRAIMPDIIHIQYPASFGERNRSVIANLLGILVRAGTPKARVITTLHEFSERRLIWRLRAFINVLTSDYVVLNNSVDHAAVRLFYPRDKCSVIPIGSSITPLTADGRNLEQPQLGEPVQADEPGKTLVFFGFVSPLKGIEIALRALKVVRAQEPNVRLRIVSEFAPEANPYHAQIDKLITELGLREAVVTYPTAVPPEMVSAMLQVSDIAVLPFDEGASERRSSLIACMSHGLAVVTTIGPLTPRDFVDGENMRLVSPGDCAATASCILDLLGNSGARERIGRGALEKSWRFDWKTIAAQTKALYVAALGG